MAPVGAEPFRHRPTGQGGRVRRVVDHDDRAPTERRQRPVHPRRGGVLEGDHRTGLGTRERDPRPLGITPGGRNGDPAEHSVRGSGRDVQFVPPAPGPLQQPDRDVVQQLVGDDHAVDLLGRQVLERAEHRAAARHRGGPVLVRVAVGAEHLEGMDQRQVLPLAGAPRGRPLDEHVAQGGERTRRGAARTARASAPRPAPASTTTKGSGRPSRATARSRNVATTAPNRGPTSGLVMKSPRSRPAPPPVAKNPPSVAVEREVGELVEADRAVAGDGVGEVRGDLCRHGPAGVSARGRADRRT